MSRTFFEIANAMQRVILSNYDISDSIYKELEKLKDSVEENSQSHRPPEFREIINDDAIREICSILEKRHTPSEIVSESPSPIGIKLWATYWNCDSSCVVDTMKRNEEEKNAHLQALRAMPKESYDKKIDRLNESITKLTVRVELANDTFSANCVEIAKLNAQNNKISKFLDVAYIELQCIRTRIKHIESDKFAAYGSK